MNYTLTYRAQSGRFLKNVVAKIPEHVFNPNPGMKNYFQGEFPLSMPFSPGLGLICVQKISSS
jgi:hypothetical protein